MGGGHKVPYPKHVWSPSGGWYCQPANWKQNTAIVGLVMAGFVAIAWTASAELEVRYKKPEPDRWYPSRHWSRQLKEWDAEDKAAAAAAAAAAKKN